MTKSMRESIYLSIYLSMCVLFCVYKCVCICVCMCVFTCLLVIFYMYDYLFLKWYINNVGFLNSNWILVEENIWRRLIKGLKLLSRLFVHFCTNSLEKGLKSLINRQWKCSSTRMVLALNNLPMFIYIRKGYDPKTNPTTPIKRKKQTSAHIKTLLGYLMPTASLLKNIKGVSNLCQGSLYKN